MKLFFDLDGTLVDASDRLYRLFIDLVPQATFSKQEYWNLKRNKQDHKLILSKYFPKVNFDKFNDKWLKLIETEKYLAFDKLYTGTINILKELSKTNQVYLVTARQSKNNLIAELKRFDIYKYFTEVFVTEQRYSKKELIQNTLADTCFFIGDTGYDVNVGKDLKIKTIAVSYGFLSRENLIQYQPDFLADNMEDILSVIANQQGI